MPVTAQVTRPAPAPASENVLQELVDTLQALGPQGRRLDKTGEFTYFQRFTW